ncbi:hypothetical protein ACU4GR_26660 [Methylobacterium oryzae CBMB20]
MAPPSGASACWKILAKGRETHSKSVGACASIRGAQICDASSLLARTQVASQPGAAGAGCPGPGLTVLACIGAGCAGAGWADAGCGGAGGAADCAPADRIPADHTVAAASRICTRDRPRCLIVASPSTHGAGGFRLAQTSTVPPAA